MVRRKVCCEAEGGKEALYVSPGHICVSLPDRLCSSSFHDGNISRRCIDVDYIQV